MVTYLTSVVPTTRNAVQLPDIDETVKDRDVVVIKPEGHDGHAEAMEHTPVTDLTDIPTESTLKESSTGTSFRSQGMFEKMADVLGELMFIRSFVTRPAKYQTCSIKLSTVEYDTGLTSISWFGIAYLVALVVSISATHIAYGRSAMSYGTIILMAAISCTVVALLLNHHSELLQCQRFATEAFKKTRADPPTAFRTIVTSNINTTILLTIAIPLIVIALSMYRL